MNKSQLYVDRTDVNGKPVGFYSKATERITKGKKKAGEPFNLYDTGDFISSIYARIDSDSIFFDATDSKKQEVMSKLLSKEIFGLSEENFNRVLRERIQPLLHDILRLKTL